MQVHKCWELQREKARLRNRLRTSKGSVIIDAAMVLPVFILSVVLILSLINEAREESRLYKDLCKNANTVSYAAELMDSELPFLLETGKTQTHEIRRTVFYRPFWGESEESEDEYTLVCIYPKSGVKYHQKYCSTVENNSNYQVVSLKEAEEMGYLPCKLCYGGPDYFKK